MYYNFFFLNLGDIIEKIYIYRRGGEFSKSRGPWSWISKSTSEEPTTLPKSIQCILIPVKKRGTECCHKLVNLQCCN